MPDVERYNRVVDELRDIYVAKNTDYGSSFADLFAEFGVLSTVIRLQDKVGRLKTLCKQEAQVKDESIRDTLLDIANYAIMSVMELDARGSS